MTMPKYVCFDLESRPLPDLVTKYAKAFPEYNEADVAVGNLKDPVKIAEKRAAAAAAHERDRIAYWANLHDRAALDPFTGAIICIGVGDDMHPPEILAEKTEAATLRQFWNLWCMSDHAVTKFVFWSGCGGRPSSPPREEGKPSRPAPLENFDIDYIVTRSRINRVPVPAGVRQGRYYSPRIIDLAKEFMLHRSNSYLSLTKAAEMFGLYAEHADLVPKGEDDIVTGATFAAWWDGKADTTRTAEEQRTLARTYLLGDVRHLQRLAPCIL